MVCEGSIAKAFFVSLKISKVSYMSLFVIETSVILSMRVVMWTGRFASFGKISILMYMNSM
jgi:hypothetical protein